MDMFVDAWGSMKDKLQTHYDKTNVPFVYGDAIILNPRCKLSIFREFTWSDIDPQPYVDGCHARFLRNYAGTSLRPDSSPTCLGSKRPAPDNDDDDDDDDDEFQAMLARQLSEPSEGDDFDRYMAIPNDGRIKSSLAYWKTNQALFPDLAKQVRVTLAVPASGCSVERMFSVSGRIATWQRSRLKENTIRDIMTYKATIKLDDMAMGLKGDELEDLEIDEVIGKIPVEWEQGFWRKKLRLEVQPGIMTRFVEDLE